MSSVLPREGNEMKKKKKSLKKGEIKRTVFTITKFASGCLPKDTKESSKS